MKKGKAQKTRKAKASPPLSDVKKMIAGPTCDECTDLCHVKNITLDKDALRFSFADGSGVNLFWVNLFSPMIGQNFQDEILKNLFRAYNECVKNEAT